MDKTDPTFMFVDLLRNAVKRQEHLASTMVLPMHERRITLPASVMLIIADRLELGEASAEVLYALRDALKTSVAEGVGPEYEEKKRVYIDEVRKYDTLWATTVGLAPPEEDNK